MIADPVGRRRVWERPALIALLCITAILYLWQLSVSGWANVYYSAAAQAGSTDWTAFLFGSSDAGNSITVDKPPASLWLMALSARAFGISPFSVLLPQALLGVATVGVSYATVRRAFPAGTALLAAGVLASTPVAALIFRYNNPDALLVLLVALATYAIVRAIEGGHLRWMLMAGAALGFAFLTKQLQAFLVLPVLAGGYLWAAPGRVRRRIAHGLAALGTLTVTAGWWVAIVALAPPGSRPWIGGTTDNDFLSLTLGYNGLGRMVGGNGNGSSVGFHSAAIDRLLSGSSGSLIGWLLPAAIVLGVLAMIRLRGSGRPSLAQAMTTVFLGGTIVMTIAFSVMSGIYHPYYTVALAPSVAACAAIGAGLLWRNRAERRDRMWLALITLGTAIWGAVLVTRTTGLPLWVALIVLLAGGLGAAMTVQPPSTRAAGTLAAVVALVAVLLGPAAASVATASVGHAGSGASAITTPGASDPSTVNPAIVSALRSGGSGYRWAAASPAGSTMAARYQLAAGVPVMPIGGYKRTDPSPTLQQFEQEVGAGQIHWFIGAGASGDIATWVGAHFTPQTIGGVTMYDLSAAGTA